MKNRIIAIALGLGCNHLTANQISIGEHVDIRWTYDTVSDHWSGRAITTQNGNDVLRNFDDVFFPLSDKVYSASNPSNSGARNIQPSSAAYAFTGVAVGDPLWIAVQGTPGNGEVWPGFENNQAAGTLGSYLETDTRLPQPQTAPREWLTVRLKNVAYQGTGMTPTFSLWTVSGGQPRIWMATADGIGAGDTYPYAIGTHNHMNWGFGALGIYRIQMTVVAYKGPGKTNPTAESPVHTLTFAVGPVANWQAEYFIGVELENTAISGLAADPDADGMENLQEYAFGYNPRKGAHDPVAAGLGLPEFSTEETPDGFYQILDFPRRKAGVETKPLSYIAEFSGANGGFTWEPQNEGTETITDFTGEAASLNAVWEKVQVKRMAPAGTEKSAFGRLRVEQE
jgi:surface-anchored protein